MKDKNKIKEKLINRLARLRQRVAELQKAEAQRKKEKEHYKTFVQTIPDILYEVTPNGIFTFLNNAIRQLGYTPEELIGKHFKKIVHTDDFKKVSRKIALLKYVGKKIGDIGSPKLFDERRTGERMTRNLDIRLIPKKIKGIPAGYRYVRIYCSGSWGVLRAPEGISTDYRYGEMHSLGKWDRFVAEKNKEFLGSIGIIRDITERKQMEGMLQKSHNELEIRVKERTAELARTNKELQKQKAALEQKNIALSEIIKQIEVEKSKIKDDIATNVNKLLFPILAKLRIKNANREYIDLLQHRLEELTSSFGSKITEESVKLTLREIEICNMIKDGLTSKEISNLLNISCRTVETHRRNIKHKLRISNKAINLSTYLCNL